MAAEDYQRVCAMSLPRRSIQAFRLVSSGDCPAGRDFDFHVRPTEQLSPALRAVASCLCPTLILMSCFIGSNLPNEASAISPLMVKRHAGSDDSTAELRLAGHKKTPTALSGCSYITPVGHSGR
jgi:hypothetical protein